MLLIIYLYQQMHINFIQLKVIPKQEPSDMFQ